MAQFPANRCQPPVRDDMAWARRVSAEAVGTAMLLAVVIGIECMATFVSSLQSGVACESTRKLPLLPSALTLPPLTASHHPRRLQIPRAHSPAPRVTPSPGCA